MTLLLATAITKTELLNIKLLGVIPESEQVLNASNSGEPVIMTEGSNAAQAYKDVVDRFLGEELEHRFLTAEKKGLFKKIFGK